MTDTPNAEKFAQHLGGAHVVSIVVTVGFVAILALALLHDVPPGTRDILTTMVGVLGGKFSTVVDFYLGSSFGSVGKLFAASSDQSTKRAENP